MTLEMPEHMTAKEARKVLGKFFVTAKPKKKSKYKNVRTKTDDGISHASKKQGTRWVYLRQMEREGKIRDLRREVKYSLDVNGVHICDYRADHVYEEPSVNGIWREVVEDVKSVFTVKKREYIHKRNLMLACHGIAIREIVK